MKCKVPHCEREAVAKGHCHSHRRTFLLYGEAATFRQKQFHGLTLRERFYRYVRTGDGCWEWLGYRDRNGYGRLNVKGLPQLASRVSYLVHNGDIPKGQCICHKCDNPACVNPDHLFLGTQADNVADMHAKGRARKRALTGADHHASKLDGEAVRNIRASEEPVAVLARRFNVSRATVYSVLKGLTWTHVK